jgi:hypothetical protein
VGSSHSLPAGRNQAPLSEDEVRRVTNTILGLDSTIPFRHGPGQRTRCRVFQEEDHEACEVVFGPDIYPGPGIATANSSLTMRAAVAHELCHYHRWYDKTELIGDKLEHLDEALTSLDAIRRYGSKLDDYEIVQLVGDAIERLALHGASIVK